ncbi:MAG: hypothetical protein ABSE93_14960 [Terriglobia bacterium]
MSKYRRMVFTRIRENCKSKLPAGGNATWQWQEAGSLERQGVGAIWHGIPFETPVIPAKAGIQFETLVIPAKAGIQPVDSAFPKVCRVDSRFRGNDCGFERPCLANEPTTKAGFCYLRERRLC